jgi:hypothetical protein
MAQVQLTVGFKHLGNTGHLVLEAEDAPDAHEAVEERIQLARKQ